MICNTLQSWKTCSNSHFTLCYFLIATLMYPSIYTQSSKGRSRLWGFTVPQYIRTMTARNSTVLNPENWFQRLSTVETFQNKILSISFLQRSVTAYPLYSYPWSLINPKLETINLIHIAWEKKWNLFLIHIFSPQRLVKSLQMFYPPLLKSGEWLQMRKTF